MAHVIDDDKIVNMLLGGAVQKSAKESVEEDSFDVAIRNKYGMSRAELADKLAKLYNLSVFLNENIELSDGSTTVYMSEEGNDYPNDAYFAIIDDLLNKRVYTDGRYLYSQTEGYDGYEFYPWEDVQADGFDIPEYARLAIPVGFPDEVKETAEFKVAFPRYSEKLEIATEDLTKEQEAKISSDAERLFKQYLEENGLTEDDVIGRDFMKILDYIMARSPKDVDEVKVEEKVTIPTPFDKYYVEATSIDVFDALGTRDDDAVYGQWGAADLDGEHIAWLKAKEEFRDKLADRSLDIVELFKDKFGNTHVGYYMGDPMGDYMYVADDEVISAVED